MIDNRDTDARWWAFSPVHVARRTATATLGPLARTGGLALGLYVELERRAIERLLDSREVERLIVFAVDEERLRATIKKVMESLGARQVLAGCFESGLFDEFVDRLVASEGFWRLVDEVAARPSVTAAITHQSLGFNVTALEEVRLGEDVREDLRVGDGLGEEPRVDEGVGEEVNTNESPGEQVRSGSRGADDWLERAARRLTRRRPDRPSKDARVTDPVTPRAPGRS